VETLKGRGVKFQHPGPGSFAGIEGKATGDVIDFGAVKSAFLKDTEGNVIALNEIIDGSPAD
jgi:hypothetical protein